MTSEANPEITEIKSLIITNDNYEEYKDKLSSQTEKLIVESINLSEKSFKITNCEIKRGELTKCEISLINDSELTNIKFNDCKDLKINKSKFTDSEFIVSQISEFKEVNILYSKLINCQKFNISNSILEKSELMAMHLNTPRKNLKTIKK